MRKLLLTIGVFIRLVLSARMVHAVIEFVLAIDTGSAYGPNYKN